MELQLIVLRKKAALFKSQSKLLEVNKKLNTHRYEYEHLKNYAKWFRKNVS